MSPHYTDTDIARRNAEIAAENIAEFAQLESELHEAGERITLLIETALQAAKLTTHSVKWRAKGTEAYARKMLKDPRRAVRDLLGIRVITMFRDDAAAVETVIRTVLKVDETTYVNKAGMLSSKEFGYRSLQFVGRLMRVAGPGEHQWWLDSVGDPAWIGAGRDSVEIQIRSVLEHAWAEVDHDIVYKPAGFVSEAVRRRFALTAALLEMADENLESIRNEIALGRPNVVPEEQPGDFITRFVETDRASMALDEQIILVLGLPKGRPEKLERELGHAVHMAGWATQNQGGFNRLHEELAANSVLALRMAIVCTDVTRSLLMSDAPGYQGLRAVAFPGIGLYWLSIALGSVHPEHAGMQSIPVGRMAEWTAVARYLIDNPAEPAMKVRARYIEQMAPNGSNEFAPISFP